MISTKMQLAFLWRPSSPRTPGMLLLPAATRFHAVGWNCRLFSAAIRLRSSVPKPLDERELSEARAWLKSFTQDDIPRNIGDLVFSRSAGPGGQNVNKVNSKATLRVPLRKLQSFVPPLLLSGLKQNSRYLANKDTEIVISSDSSRSQATNIDECYRKLYDAIVSSTTIPGETSAAQKERVKKLSQAFNEKRLKEKRKTHLLQ